MKRKALFIIGLSMLLVPQAFACEGVSENAVEMHAALAKTNTPENVQAVALQRKAMYCTQNAKNLGLKGDRQTSYVTSCINENDALKARTAFLKGQKI